LKPTELFEFILRDFGVPYEGSDKGDVLETLHQWLIKRHAMGDAPVLIIDEAQAISVRTLDQVRLLLNLEAPGSKLLQIVLAGQPELEDKLRRPELRQLRQRVMFRCSLVPLSLEEASQYIKSRLAAAGAADVDVFSPESVVAAHMYSRGIPRTLNLLCEHALISGFADELKVITPEIIRHVATNFDLTFQPAVDEEREINSRFGRLVAFRPEVRTPRVTAQMEYLESITQDANREEAVLRPVRDLPQESPARELTPAAMVEEAIPSPPPTVGLSPDNMDAPVVARPLAAASLPQVDRPVAVSTGAAAAAPAKLPANANPPQVTPAEASGVKPQEPRNVAVNHATTHSGASHPSIANQVVTLVAKPSNLASPPRHRVAARRQGPTFGERFLRYWKDVKDSFLFDWKQFMGAHGLAKSVVANTSVSSLQRNVIVPITKWLTEPVALSPRGKSGPAQAARKRR
jgi:hypothetical protein